MMNIDIENRNIKCATKQILEYIYMIINLKELQWIWTLKTQVTANTTFAKIMTTFR